MDGFAVASVLIPIHSDIWQDIPPNSLPRPPVQRERNLGLHPLPNKATLVPVRIMARLINLDTGEVIASRLRVCTSTPDRLRGLLGTARLDDDQAVWITPCNSIHTFFMLLSIDAAFLDRDYRVIKLIRDMTPFRVCLPVIGAIGVVEGSVGMIRRGRLRRGTRLRITRGEPAGPS